MGRGDGGIGTRRVAFAGLMAWMAAGAAIAPAAGVAQDDGFPLLEAVTQGLEDALADETPRLWPQEQLPPTRRWASLHASIPGGGTLLIELPEYVNAEGAHLPPAADAAFFSGRTGIAARYLPDATPEWTRDGDAWALEVRCGTAVTFAYRVTASPGRIDIRSDLTHNTGGVLERIFQVFCVSVSADSGYHNLDPLTTHFLYGGDYSTWTAVTDLDRIWRPGQPGDEGVFWLECPVKGSGRVLNPYHRRAVMTGEADSGVLVQDHALQSRSKLVLVGEPGGSVFKNCRGGCLHVNPSVARAEPGETVAARMAILFCETEVIAEVLRSSAAVAAP